ncbi:Guanine nucleotide exchange factor LTE1 [Nakaseomyces bracarensis]|uniref:Guanine nucleotide exchange factor LTE1 n=1 Tax=Nakaseomyces bracarensis TaxID=273131 RepID=A0ABR4NMN7_9SACH
MDIFGQKDYYPVPSNEVIKYKRHAHKKGSKKEILKADIPAIIVHLSSPNDTVDYSSFSDFFLFYRNFLSAGELYDYLILRFKWCIREIESNSYDEKNAAALNIAKVALIRTFVLLRHGMLNHFGDDFLQDENLRLRIVSFLNDRSTTEFKIIISCMVSLKKVWMYSAKLHWENVMFNEPLMNTFADWIDYNIKDVSQLDMVQKRRSRISAHGIQSITNPEARNRSILSIYKAMDIPDLQNARPVTLPNRRTPSMLLQQRDTSNSYVTSTLTERHKVSKISRYGMGTFERQNTHRNTVSRLTRMSNILQDAKTLRSSDVNRILPSTPAKSVELILNTIYSPEALEAQRSTKNTKLYDTDTSQLTGNFHKGIISLLAKWKKNHKNNAKENLSSLNKIHKRETDMDNFVKYVISISSLNENKLEDIKKLNENLDSKFDILSARTIDEVEYIVQLENDLFMKLKELESQLQGHDTHFGTVDQDNSPNNLEFSAMDNLDLYKTVNTIARSVISLTNTINNINKSNPTFSHGSFDRRKVKSSMPQLYDRAASLSGLGSYTSLKFYDASDEVNDVSYEDDKPERLVFLDNNMEGSKNMSPKMANGANVSTSSPLKNVLPNLLENYSTDTVNTGDASSFITYDSQFTQNITPHRMVSRMRTPSLPEPAIKKKTAFNNLREFTFENTKENVGSESGSFIDIINSPVTSIEKRIPLSPITTDNIKSSASSKKSLVRPASGRISIVRGASNSPSPTLKKVVEFKDTDGPLVQAEEKLLELERTIRQSKVQRSEAHDEEAQANDEEKDNSEEMSIVAPEQEEVNIDSKPEIKSMQDESDFNMTTSSSGGSISIQSEQDLRTQYWKSLGSPQKSLNHSQMDSLKFYDSNAESEVDRNNFNNKYLFSPDTESIDVASPVKNVDDLKSKFLKTGDQSETSSQVAESIVTDITDASKADNIFGSKLDKNGLKNILTASEEKLSKDPVELALMKLEGTFKRNKNNGESDTDLEKEVENLNIADLPDLGNSPVEKRKSLLIERRRQTMYEIPHTPSRSSVFGRVMESDQLSEKNIKDLISQYHIEDESLLIKNHTNHIPFILMYESKQIAYQLTLIEVELFNEIDWKDLLDMKILYKGPTLTSWLQLLVQNEELTGVDLAVARFNLTVDWAISEIVLTTDVKMKRNTIERFIHVAEHCRKIQNFNSMMQIILALNSVIVQKFTEAWRLIEPGDMLLWEELRGITALDWNYHTIRSMMKCIDPLKGCIPFIVVYLSDLSINAEKRTWITEKKVVNYSKFNTNVQIVKNFIQKVQWSKYYKIESDQELLSKCVYISSLSQDEIKFLTSEFAR